MITPIFNDPNAKESPIEDALERALIANGLDQRWVVSKQVPIWDREHNRSWPRYILDFELRHVCENGRVVIVDVECDGEEFHQDTERDGTRDAYQRRNGYTVVRFTGTEIYRATAQIVAYLDVLMWSLINRGRNRPSWLASQILRPTVRQKPDGSYEPYWWVGVTDGG